MGFEIVLLYFDRNPDGPGYDVTETKQMKRKIGKPQDDVSYEKLACAITMQMARRDIMVTDVEVYEYTKKKVAFKETKGGVIIGNKKYSFDQCSSQGFTEIEEERPPILSLPDKLPVPVGTRPVQPQIQVDPSSIDGGNVGDLLYFQKHRPIREEMFTPKDKMLAAMAKERRMPFTVGKVYPIYEEKLAPGGIHAGMVYTVRDDTGSRNVVSDKFFDVVPVLYGGDLFNDDVAIQGPTEPADMDMPDVRMRR